MASPKKPIPSATVVMPDGKGRVEITVDGDRIWLSDYSDEGRRNFTLLVPRKPLRGNDTAREGICAHRKNAAGKAASTVTTAAAPADPPMPEKAGYWYVAQDYAHGNPVTVIEE